MNDFEAWDWDSGTVRINGETYADSFSLGLGSRPAWWSWALGRKCTRVKVAAGLEDGSDADSVARLEVIADDNVKFSRVMEPGESESLDIPVDDVFSLKLKATNLGKSYLVRSGGWAAFGEPRAYCRL